MILEMTSVEKGFDSSNQYTSGNWKINPAPLEQMNSAQALWRLSPVWRIRCKRDALTCLAVSEGTQQVFWGVRTKVCFVKDAFEQEGFQSKVKWKSIIEVLWLRSKCCRGAGRQDGTWIRLLWDSNNGVWLVRVGQPQILSQKIFYRGH